MISCQAHNMYITTLNQLIRSVYSYGSDSTYLDGGVFLLEHSHVTFGVVVLFLQLSLQLRYTRLQKLH